MDYSKIFGMNSKNKRQSKKRKYTFGSESEDEDHINGTNSAGKRQNLLAGPSSSEDKSECGDEDVCKFSRENFAFSIEDIFEQILSSVDTATLFRCRRVSHRWRIVSTKILKSGENGKYISVSKPKLLKLTLFWKESYTQGGPFTIDTFPCNKLSITDCPLNYPELQTLLSEYGEHLRHLIFSFTSCEALCESDFIKQVKILLCAQAPNLENLDFRGISFTNIKSAAFNQNALLEANRVRILKNTKLRTLTLRTASRKVIDSIIAISPNLHEIDVDFDDYYLLAEPTNLLHFVREFEFDYHHYRRQGHMMNSSVLEAAILMSPEERRIQNLPPIKCTRLWMDFNSIVKDINRQEDVRLSFVRIINKILESSWDTLETVGFLSHTGETLKGLEWPGVLPKVKRFFSLPHNSCGLELFPLNGSFKIQDTFPRVQDIYLYVSHENIKDSSAEDFSRKRKLGPVTSVLEVDVTVYTKKELDWDEDEVDEDKLYRFYSKKLLYNLFPHVDVSLSCEYI